MRQLLAGAAIVAALVAAGCNSSSNPGPNPTNGPTCTLPSGVQSALVYPAPGSTGVVDNNGQIIIGSTSALPSNWQVVIVDAVFPNGAPWPQFQNTNPPFPSPSQTPGFANPQYQSSTPNVPFASNQVVTVYLNNTNSNCTPLQLGSFNT